MKKILLMMTCALCTGLVFQSCRPSDQKLNNEVTTVLKAEYPTVSASTTGGVVSLTGAVDSEQEKIAVERTVLAQKHVIDVINEVQVREPIPVPEPVVNEDQALKDNILSKLGAAGYKEVKVDVVGGEVVLSGELMRSNQTKVMQIVNEAKPKKVTNNLKLK